MRTKLLVAISIVVVIVSAVLAVPFLFSTSGPSNADVANWLKEQADLQESRGFVPKMKIRSASIISKEKEAGELLVRVKFKAEVEYLKGCFLNNKYLFNCPLSYKVLYKDFEGNTVVQLPTGHEVIWRSIRTKVLAGEVVTGKGEMFLSKDSDGWKLLYEISKFSR